MFNQIGVLFVSGGVVAATIVVLGIGIAIGYRFGLQAGGRVLLSPAFPDLGKRERELARKFEICQQVLAAVQQRSGALADVASNYRRVAPPVLLLAIDQLVETTAALAAQLQQASLLSPPDPTPASIPPAVDWTAQASERALTGGPTEPASISEAPALQRHAEIATVSRASTMQATASEDDSPVRSDERLTVDEMQTLAGGVTREIDDSPKQRYQYNCSQIVIPWDDEAECRDISRAATVRCDNISVQGVSFFWPNVPDFERLIISLGTAEMPIFMLAEVAHSKSVFMHGEVQVLVGARFTGRHIGEQGDQPVPRPISPSANERDLVGV